MSHALCAMFLEPPQAQAQQSTTAQVTVGLIPMLLDLALPPALFCQEERKEPLRPLHATTTQLWVVDAVMEKAPNRGNLRQSGI
jgi:hypothetical protein